MPRPQPQRFQLGWYEVEAGHQQILGCKPVNAFLPRGTWVLSSMCPTHCASFPAVGLVKDAARPAYWVPDHEILHCHNCRKEFSIKLSKHHCRACGQGFCDECSHDRRAVPSRGWDHPVRVCFNCNKKPGDL